jgi:short-subunit dehydrogenase
MATALVTGATAGIGYSYAQLLAKEGFDLVLVARDLPRLNKVAKDLGKTYGIKVESLKADLTKPAQLAKVEKRLASTAKPIEVLINNAGFGIKDSFIDSSLAKEQELLDVLVTAPMRLSHAVLPQMVKRDSGVIVNVSSVASFIAGGTYSAAKSYLTVFSEYLYTELRNTNIKVSALCPGFTRTEFHARGKMKMTGLPNYMWLSTDQVVKKSWRDAKAGKVICIPGFQYLILSTIARIAPRPIVRKAGINVRRKQRVK